MILSPRNQDSVPTASASDVIAQKSEPCSEPKASPANLDFDDSPANNSSSNNDNDPADLELAGQLKLEEPSVSAAAVRDSQEEIGQSRKGVTEKTLSGHDQDDEKEEMEMYSNQAELVENVAGENEESKNEVFPVIEVSAPHSNFLHSI